MTIDQNSTDNQRHLPHNDTPTSPTAEPKENEGTLRAGGYRVFSWLKAKNEQFQTKVDEFVDSVFPFTDDPDDKLKAGVVRKGNGSQDGDNEGDVASKYASLDEAVGDLSMEDIMPLETWKKMNSNERHFYLDKFYSMRDKYRFEREGKEMCAKEELDIFMCGKADSMFKSMFDSSKSWEDRFDGCAKTRNQYTRCVEVMQFYQKTRAVFGRDAKYYLKVIDDETRSKR